MIRTVLLAHLHSFSVREGDVVKKGQKLGVLGDTGYSFGAHLHLTVFDRPVSRWMYQSEIPQLGGSKELTEELAGLPIFLTYKGEDRERRITTAYGDVYDGGVRHWGIDMYDKGQGLPDINWPYEFDGIVTARRDFGEGRWGKALLIQADDKPTEKETEGFYVVKSGDTLWEIAKKFSTTVRMLVHLNKIENPDRIYPGQKIMLPGVFYLVQHGDTLSEIAAQYGTTYQELARRNGIDNPNLIYPGQQIKVK